MDTTVNLQNPIEYSLWVSLLAGGLIILAIVLFAVILIRALALGKKKAAVQPQPAMAAAPRVMMPKSKEHYIQRVQSIKKRYAEGSVSKRSGYQELSAVVREFVHEATGINVENLTVSEVKAMGMGMLDVLMEEYYVPEFAEDERAEKKNLTNSCDRTEGVIRSWN